MIEAAIVSSAQKLDLKPAVIRGLLEILLERGSDGETMMQLGQALALPKKNLGRLLTELSDFFLPKSARVILKPVSQKLIRDYFEEKKQVGEASFSQLQKIFARLGRGHYQGKRKYDQFLATEETVWRRAEFLQAQGELWQREILFLGDDDLTSVAVALLGQARMVTVLEIDPDVLKLIEIAKSEFGLKIKTTLSDLTQASPQKFSQVADVVFTDPPYTPAGIALFLNWGISCLRKRNASSLYFCYGNSERNRGKKLALHKIILERGLLLRQLWPNFNQYQGAASIGANSDLYGVVLTEVTKKVALTKAQSARLYTYQ